MQFKQKKKKKTKKKTKTHEPDRPVQKLEQMMQYMKKMDLVKRKSAFDACAKYADLHHPADAQSLIWTFAVH